MKKVGIFEKDRLFSKKSTFFEKGSLLEKSRVFEKKSTFLKKVGLLKKSRLFPYMVVHLKKVDFFEKSRSFEKKSTFSLYGSTFFLFLGLWISKYTPLDVKTIKVNANTNSHK